MIKNTILILILLLSLSLLLGSNNRPYEINWANRTTDDHPPFIDFEKTNQFFIKTKNAEASFKITSEQQIWGDFTGKLSYKKTDANPKVNILLDKPKLISQKFNTISCWIYGNNFETRPDPDTPPVDIYILIEDRYKKEHQLKITRVNWKEWFLVYYHLNDHQQKLFSQNAYFKGFLITKGTNKEFRTLYFDNLTFFQDKMDKISFNPLTSKKTIFDKQQIKLNTDAEKLPFPTREKTILPDNLTSHFKTEISIKKKSFSFIYDGADGKLIYKITPSKATFNGISATWTALNNQTPSQIIHPCQNGGAKLLNNIKINKIKHLGFIKKGKTIESKWQFITSEGSINLKYIYRLWNKSLIIDIISDGGKIREIKYGHAISTGKTELIENPYYTYGKTRPSVAFFNTKYTPLFLSGNTDWYLSNASELWSDNIIIQDSVFYNGGSRYLPKTDGNRNNCFERFFITLSPYFEEVLPNIPNPTSPWKEITGSKIWKSYGVSNRKKNKAYWKSLHRYGLTEMVVTDHETMWRDGYESFTFRTKTAPDKGGDSSAYDYTRFMIDTLGFTYGPYNTFTAISPVNEYWQTDLLLRTSNNKFKSTWPRCYTPKPSKAVKYCATLTPKIQEKFHFNTGYCDVHTARTPWERVDYDSRVSGAGTFSSTYYAYSKILLLQKEGWKGPVYSEGGSHYLYSGIADGNYAQDQKYFQAEKPWLVDFDLRKMHDLSCNFGMGSTSMFFGKNIKLGSNSKELNSSIDRFLAATIAFGHSGFLVTKGGFENILKSYYMIQQLQKKYTQTSIKKIYYTDKEGKLLPTGNAIAKGIHNRSQVVNEYENGFFTAVNGNKQERMKLNFKGKAINLPPNGYMGWSKKGEIFSISSDFENKRFDYAVSPLYIYFDGRGNFNRQKKAAGSGLAVCRFLEKGKYEIIPYNNSECGFAIDADKAIAVDKDYNEIATAEIRKSRGLTYVLPVKRAFSYILESTNKQLSTKDNLELRSDRDIAVPGESVAVYGTHTHHFTIPTNANKGDRIWKKFEGKWIDFTVIPLYHENYHIDKNNLIITIRCNISDVTNLNIEIDKILYSLKMNFQQPVSLTIPLKEIKTNQGLFEINISSGKFNKKSTLVLENKEIFNSKKITINIDHGGVAYRGKKEKSDLRGTKAYIKKGLATCGNITKKGILIQPPWKGGTGYTFLLFKDLLIPKTQSLTFRALVGKRDGSNLGDGLLYKVAVIDDSGKERIVSSLPVTSHNWKQIEADLSEYAGKTINIKLIADAGKNDNPNGDWGCFADIRIENLKAEIQSKVYSVKDIKKGNYEIAELSLKLLKNAKKGWLCYDGIGLAGADSKYTSFAVLNGLELGNMTKANGNAVKNIWTIDSKVELSKKAIRNLSFINTFTLKNPNRDYFKIANFHIELELADGRKCSSYISQQIFSQPQNWKYGEGNKIPFGENIETKIFFK